MNGWRAAETRPNDNRDTTGRIVQSVFAGSTIGIFGPPCRFRFAAASSLFFSRSGGILWRGSAQPAGRLNDTGYHGEQGWERG